ncbi:MAG TPA: GDP-mannose 4,6-dehydratase, partial [Acidimicrobiales bacterium]|nr:GDP-mannose 4,6-dehydratase [Acidimicrobiales bacterium]
RRPDRGGAVVGRDLKGAKVHNSGNDLFRGKRLLVTGGAGFIGSHLVDCLAGLGPDRLVVVDDLSLGRRENLAEASAPECGVELHQIDLMDRAAVFSVLGQVEPHYVFNLAVVPLPASLERPSGTFLSNTMGCLNLCEGQRHGLLGRMVHFSSSEAYGTCVQAPMAEDHPLNATTPYAASKAAADLLVSSYGETFGTPWITVRPFNNYGPRQNTREYAGIVPTAILRALRGEPIVVFGDGLQSRDYLYVEDTVAATIALVGEEESWGHAVNVASEREITILDLVDAIGSALGRELELDFRPPRAADVQRHVGDTTLLSKLTGYRPTVGLEEGMARTVEWYRRNCSTNA